MPTIRTVYTTAWHVGTDTATSAPLTVAPRNNRLRVFLPSSQAGDGYLWGVSRSLLALHR